MMSMNISDVAILNIKDSDYCCIISLISKNEAIHLLQNVNLTEKVEYFNKLLVIKKILKTILKLYIKMEKTITKFGDNEIKKQKIHQYKRPILKKIQRLIK